MWIVYSTAAAIFAALVVVLSKAGIKKVDPILVFGVQTVCMLLVTWSVIIGKNIQRGMLQIDRRIWMYILAAGVLTAFSSLLSFHSLKLGHASRTASYEKVSLVFSVVLSVIFLKDRVSWQAGVGVILMVAGALFIAFSDDPAK
jgi:transporter family protein